MSHLTSAEFPAPAIRYLIASPGTFCNSFYRKAPYNTATFWIFFHPSIRKSDRRIDVLRYLHHWQKSDMCAARLRWLACFKVFVYFWPYWANFPSSWWSPSALPKENPREFRKYQWGSPILNIGRQSRIGPRPTYSLDQGLNHHAKLSSAERQSTKSRHWNRLQYAFPRYRQSEVLGKALQNHLPFPYSSMMMANKSE